MTLENYVLELDVPGALDCVISTRRGTLALTDEHLDASAVTSHLHFSSTCLLHQMREF